MEKRIIQKVNDYIEIIKKKLIEDFPHELIDSSFQIKGQDELVENYLDYIKSIEPIQFEKGDFTKRNRAKNTIPLNDRCMARRANSEQCTRRKNKGCDYCGTHAKGVPHGIMTNDNEFKYKKHEVWAEDINGIIYYIDKQNNVYKTEDILNNIINPRIIYKWKMNDSNYVLIPI